MELYLAPLEGITTYVYRTILDKHYGGIDKYYTPFLTASHLKGRELRDVNPENNVGLNLVPQILTNDSDLFLTITRQLVDLGYDEVNLNLGCPSGTVVSKGRGAGFLDRPDELERFLYDIYNRISGYKRPGDRTDGIKISIKTRIGMEFESEWDDILEIYRKFPISELIIHPRLRSDFYAGEVRLDAYRRATEVLGKKIKLCYNGDITDCDTYYKKMIGIGNETLTSNEKCAAVMLGRGVIMNPELPGNLKHNLTSDPTHENTGTRKPAPNLDSDSPSSLVHIPGPDPEHPLNLAHIPGPDPDPDRNRLKAFLKELTEAYEEEMANEKQVVMKMKEHWTYLSQSLHLDKKKLKAIHKATRLTDYNTAVQLALQK